LVESTDPSCPGSVADHGRVRGQGARIEPGLPATRIEPLKETCPLRADIPEAGTTAPGVSLLGLTR
jgi:hypothetical protein